MTMSDTVFAINLPAIVAEVTAAFDRYEAALMTNDVEVLNELFWNDARTLRYGATENLYGHAEIAQFRGARPPHDLARKLLKVVVTTYGRNYGTANCEFERGGKLGRQSHTWIRTNAGWRIAAAHVSMLQTKSGTPP
jgi:hypothetical protein